MPVMFGTVSAPSTASAAVGSNQPALQGRQGDLVFSELNGKYYTDAYNGNVFQGGIAVLTVPAFAGSLASVFSLYNPAGSTRNLAVVSVDLGIILATTVVNFVGLYGQFGIGSNTTIPSSITVASTNTPSNGIYGAGSVSQGKFLSAATHVGASTTFQLLDIVTTFGAVTTTNASPIHRDYDGALILPPGSIVSLAMSTAAGTASGLAASIRWVEKPL